MSLEETLLVFAALVVLERWLSRFGSEKNGFAPDAASPAEAAPHYSG